LDALPPPSLILYPGPAPQGNHTLPASTKAVDEKVKPLRWSVSDGAPPRVNLLIPTIDLHHFFGGYITKLNLARRLADRGLRVRIVTVDPAPPLPGDWRQTVESYSGLDGLFDNVELTFGREAAGVEASPADRFIATSWWTAHIAHDAVQVVGGDRFAYLIQEYEPFTFPMGTFAALAGESYRFPHFALFSSELLRGYFREHGLGVYQAGTGGGDRASDSFENAITRVDVPPVERLARRNPHKLLFYARPEPHASRNMFDLGLLALSRALTDGVFWDEWELHGIGTADVSEQISLGNAELALRPRCDQGAYARLLREHDVGLALMFTPHPSLVPIEMASAGMLTVTNSFENKTPEAMAEISPNLIVAEPTVDGVASALREAVTAVTDVERRVRGSQVRWSSDWNESFDDELLERLAGELGANHR
jgi:hypothetical protein